MNFIITTLFIVSCIVAVAHGGDYYQIDGFTYFTSYPEMRNWYQAKRFCSVLGTLLIDVPNEDDNDIIQTVIHKTETKYNLEGADWWTSGTDQGSDKQFYWDTTGDAFAYTDWHIEEPDHGHLENCVHYSNMRYSQMPKWNDANCLREFYFICRDKHISE